MQSTTVVGGELDELDEFDALLEPKIDVAQQGVARAPSLEDAVFQDLDYHALSRELARKIHPPEALIRRFGLTREQLVLLCSHQPFQRMVAVERAAWRGTDNAGERAKQYHREGQAHAASEIVSLILDRKLPASVRIDAAKLSAKIAGIDGEPRNDRNNMYAAGTPFAINIHLGDGVVERISSSPQKTIEGGESP
jgi:hypothetical protein